MKQPTDISNEFWSPRWADRNLKINSKRQKHNDLACPLNWKLEKKVNKRTASNGLLKTGTSRMIKQPLVWSFLLLQWLFDQISVLYYLCIICEAGCGSYFIPLLDEPIQSFLQICCWLKNNVRSITYTEDIKPLFNLFHPKTMNMCKIKRKMRVLHQLSSDYLTMVLQLVVTDDLDRCDGWLNLLIRIVQESDHLNFPFPFIAETIDMTSPNINCRHKIQYTFPFIFMFKK